MARRRWSELSPAGRRAVAIGSVMELAMTVRALVDLARRPAWQVRGPKWLWAIGCFVQPIGPLAYLKFGRRP